MMVHLACSLSTIATGARDTLPETLPLISQLGSTSLIVLAPFIAIAGTSFVKIALVLAFLRAALGTPGIPPNSVLTALAAVLSIFVMAPVGSEIVQALETAGPVPSSTADPFGIANARILLEIASPPLRDFLSANTPTGEISYFLGLASTPEQDPPGMATLLSAFATAEIAEGFLIGFLLYIPFVVVDLIVANTLLALGMHMLSPLAISTPLKLLLFIAVDGWHILLTGLLINYSP